VVAGPFPAKYWMFIHPKAVMLMLNDYIMPLLYFLQNTFQSKPRTKVLQAKNLGNISSANQPLSANHANFNLGYRINIQGAWGDWVILQLTTTLLQIPLPLPLRTPLDFDPVVQIEICMVCTRLVCI